MQRLQQLVVTAFMAVPIAVILVAMACAIVDRDTDMRFAAALAAPITFLIWRLSPR